MNLRWKTSIVLIILFTFGCGRDGSDLITRSNDNDDVLPPPSEVRAYGGKHRIKLVWQPPLAEAQVDNYSIWWNGDRDSLSVAPARRSLLIDSLAEGSYAFSVAAFDSAGRTSTKVMTRANAYGEEYEALLVNRPIEEIAYDEAGPGVTVTWGAAEAGVIASQIRYTNISGKSLTLSASPSSGSTTLENFYASQDSIFTYRTLFLPEPEAIDTFYTAYDSVEVESISYDVVTLQADGPGDTYELLGSVLGGSPEEVPDCAHPDFGRHITEEFDSDLNKNVFAFFAHVTPDNDRCGATDRQRTEIKTYSPSPDNVKAFNGDEMIFTWKFKLATGFQPSQSFTHIHQIKAGDGSNAGSPLITLTPRYGSPDKLEIIHTGNSGGTTLGKVKIVDLTQFKGTWVEATEKIKFGTHGTYELVLKRVSDGTVLLSYSNKNIDLWRTNATFIRPKWGIYRSLNNSGRLRDEKVLFADFVIGKKE